MEKFNVSKAAVKKATARLGLSRTQAENILPKYAQGASFVWTLESTSGSQSVYDNPREQVRLVIAENNTILDVYPVDYALRWPPALSDDVLQSLKVATRNALIAERDAVHRKWCEVEVDFHSNSYEIARRRLALIAATGDDELRIKRRLAQLCAENKRLHNERSALRKERTELERALVPYI